MDRRLGLLAGAAFSALLVVLVVGSLRGSGVPRFPVAPTGTGGDAVARVDPAMVYDPVRSGEPLPSGYRQLLGRDQIHPVYHPRLVPAEAVAWADATLVIGVTGTATAKAYPVSHLNRREMVNDSLEGIPILVSW